MEEGSDQWWWVDVVVVSGGGFRVSGQLWEGGGLMWEWGRECQ